MSLADLQPQANPEYHSLLWREVCLRKQIKEARKQLGLEFYEPHHFQDQFHRAGAKKSRLAEAGNRSGKSEMGVVEDVCWLRGERPFYSKTDPARYAGIPQERKIKGIVITTDWDKCHEVFTSEDTGKLWKYFPRGFAKACKNRQGYVDQIICENGNSLWFDTSRSFKNNPLGGESSQWDFAHFDEPLSKKNYIAISRGLMDTQGSEWFTLTPLQEPWIHYKFFPSRSFDDSDVRMYESSEFNWGIRFSIYDNPHIHPDAIRKFEADLTQDEREARLYGVPLAMSGLVYKEFQYHRHVMQSLPEGWKDFHLPPEDWTTWYTIDPHPRTPHAVLFNAISPLGYQHFFDEIFRQCTIKQLCAEIAVKLWNRFVGGAFVDPIAFVRDSNHRTMADEFNTEGFFLGIAPKELENGIIQAKKNLSERDMYGEPIIKFSPRLTRTLSEFDTYVWDDDSNKPKDENDHMMENFYRQQLIRPYYIDAKKFSSSNGPINPVEITGTDLGLDPYDNLGDDW